MLTVLVVDDAMTDRALIKGLLTRTMECNVLEACDGREALVLIESDRPHLVLTDLNMPEMDGLELVAAVKENYPLTPVILMTAQGSEDIAVQALETGAASYVPKRRCADDLPETVRRVLTGSCEHSLDPQVMHYLTDSHMEFTLHNDPAAISALVGFCQQMLRCLPLSDETERLRVGIAFEAALLNACIRGNLEIDGSGSATREENFELARERVGQARYRDRRVHARVNINRDRAEFIVRDDGPGFDTGQLQKTADRIADPGSAGRGITLMRTFMDDVSFNEAGNEVTLVKRRYEVDDDEMEDADD